MMPEKLSREFHLNLKAMIARRTALGKDLWQEFLRLHPADIAQFLSDLAPRDFKALLEILPVEKMAQVFNEFSVTFQAITLSHLDDHVSLDLLNSLTADQIADLFENLSDEDLKKYLNLLHRSDREKVLSLLKFAPESAGGVMNTDVLALYEEFSVKQSIELIQRVGVKKELHQQIFVINTQKQLVGHIMLEDLVLHKPQDKIQLFMRPNELVVLAEEDQESIAHKMLHYNLLIAPVVGNAGYFLGVISTETLVDIIGEEASEDVYRMSAMEPVRGTYFEIPFIRLLYRRGYILIALLLAQSLSSAIMIQYEGLLQGFLVVFVTMLASTGGNASSQTSAVIIQGMASGEINENNLGRFFRREILLAFAMAMLLGLTAFARVYITSGNWTGSIAVSVSLACIVVVSMSIGSTIPVIFKRLKIDPAYSAGPVLATVMDILGLLIYCNVSKMFVFS